MKKLYSLPLAIAALVFTISPQLASAHGHTSFEINEKVYSFVVGSLNEPVAVDDKTGVDLRVTRMTHAEHEAIEAGATITAKPLAGLETTLKVELQAGDKRKFLTSLRHSEILEHTEHTSLRLYKPLMRIVFSVR